MPNAAKSPSFVCMWTERSVWRQNTGHSWRIDGEIHQAIFHSFRSINRQHTAPIAMTQHNTDLFESYAKLTTTTTTTTTHVSLLILTVLYTVGSRDFVRIDVFVPHALCPLFYCHPYNTTFDFVCMCWNVSSFLEWNDMKFGISAIFEILVLTCLVLFYVL